MKRFIVYLVTILTAMFVDSCVPSSSDKIEIMKDPDNALTKDFGVGVSGKTIYQFYQKYGFTDVEEQMILIVKTDNVDFLTADLPFDSLYLKKINKINMQKFTTDKSINFDPERTMQEDIRIESKEYDAGEDKYVFHSKGKYGLEQSDSTETIFVFDRQTGLLYIESKKWN